MRVNYRKKPGKVKKALARASKVQKTLSEGGLNKPDDSLGQDHSQAVQSGNQVQQASRVAQPGKAQAIIKNRRV